MHGGVALPQAAVKVTIKPDANSKDDSARIQSAIDQVSKMSIDARGLRGAVLLEKGTYTLAHPLKITSSGVVLRGSGSDETGTVLRAVMHEKCTLISVSGGGNRKDEAKHQISDSKVPIGANSFSVDSTAGLKVGDE